MSSQVLRLNTSLVLFVIFNSIAAGTLYEFFVVSNTTPVGTFWSVGVEKYENIKKNKSENMSMSKYFFIIFFQKGN